MKNLELSLGKYRGCLSVRADMGNGKPIWADTRVKDNTPQIMLFGWILSRIRDAFYSMPYDGISLRCTEGFAKDNGELINSIAALIDKTNGLISEYQYLEGTFSDNDSILFINVSEDLRYGSLYRQLHRANPASMYYLNTDAGFDRVNRKWGERNIIMPIVDLVNYLTTNKIGKIMTINYYVSDTYSEKLGINLIAFLKFLGIEYIIINNDPPDLRTHAYLFKAFSSDPDVVQFSNMAALNEWWDEYYHLDNMQYCAIPQDYESSKLMTRLPDDYDIVVLSNSRLANVETMKGAIESLLPIIPGSNRYVDMQLYYMAMRHMVLNILDITEFERLTYNSLLHQFYFTLAQYLKYEIIGQLKTKRKVNVYGDVGWKQICPDLYRGSLSNGQIDNLFAEGNHLYLLLNFSLSYLDASAPVYDMIRRGVPFINVPPMIKTSDLDGLNKIEYTDQNSLNSLVNDFNSMVDDPGLKSSLSRYRDLLISSTSRIESVALNTDNVDRLQYIQSLCAHDNVMQGAITNYLSQNENMIRNSFRAVFAGSDN